MNEGKKWKLFAGGVRLAAKKAKKLIGSEVSMKQVVAGFVRRILGIVLVSSSSHTRSKLQ